MAISLYYCDPAIAADSGTGTIGDPYGDLQFALDSITRNATDGDQICIKAGTAEVLAASLSLATYGTPAEGAPLVLRGYTSTANDGGRGAISYPGNAIINSSTLDYIYWVDLDLSGGGNPTRMITLDDFNLFLRCKFTPDKGGEAVAYGLALGDNNRVIGCKFTRDNGYGFALASTATNSNLIAWCFSDSVTGLTVGNNYNVFLHNIAIVRTTTNNGITASLDENHLIGNIVYNTTAGTAQGIVLGNSSGRQNSIAINNIVVGQSGSGGVGIGSASGCDVLMVGYNAYYNNSTNYSAGGDTIVDLGGDVSLGANPFTDAANGDFSLTETAKTALRSAGWPASYLGAHANSDPHITIGAMQYGPAVTAGGMGGIFGSIVR